MTQENVIQSTWIEAVTYDWLTDPEARPILIHEGGTRSSKTYNACIAWAEYLLEKPEWLSIVRATGPALQATVVRDMIEVLRRMGVYSDKQHKKTENIITLPGGGTIEFFATDMDQKVHGRKRDHLWCNEANEISEDLFDQLTFRTRHRILLDYNPSMREDHWIWKRFDSNERVLRYRSTYKDNPFLSPQQIATIEAMQLQDDWKWQVYGMGKRGVPEDTIFRNVFPLEAWPDVPDYVYGLDFGYNDPTSLQKIGRRDGEPRAKLYAWSLIHESHLTNNDLIRRMLEIGVEKNVPIYCDAAEPDRIEELNRAGFWALPADKGPGSVRAGISFLQSHDIYVGGPAGHRSRNEWKAYRWRKIRGIIQDDPAHDDSHAPDSARYAAYTHYFNSISSIITL
jgi:phage terminase large subunit